MRKLNIAVAIVMFLSSFAQAQSQSLATGESTVPRLVSFNGMATDVNGKPLTGIVGITFSIYQDQQGGTPLWFETQNVSPNPSGRYTATLGTTKSGGLPMQLFTSGEARWLGVQIEGQSEQPRILLLSVPYALKAADAETVGGLPPSAFVLAAPQNGGGPSSPAVPQNSQVQPSLGGSGTQNYIPLWTDSSGDLGNSILYQSGTTLVGVGTNTPAGTLDVNGSVISRGTLQLLSTGTANASQGYNSQPTEWTSSVFNSGTGTAVPQNFVWQAEPINNNQNTASGTLNLLFATGSNKPSETGLNIAGTGIVNFVKTQTFPNTLTGITAGTGINVTGSKTNPTVGINVTFADEYYAQLKASNTFTASQTVNGTMTATNFSGNGSGLTNVNASQLGGLPSTAFALLNAANTFTGNQTVNGNVSATGLVTGSAFNLGSNLFGWGSYSNGTAFMGYAGNTTTTGYQNTGSGYQALYLNTSGSDNTATGYAALNSNTTGSDNTASGAFSLATNSTGANNTAIGFQALYVNTTGSANTASGTAALGNNSTGTGNTATGTFALSQNTSGIANTATGEGTLQVNSTGASNTAAGANALYYNTTGSDNTASGSIALYQNTTGYYNTATGLASLSANTTGWANTASGASSLSQNTTGGNNTAAGYDALQFNATGSNNTAIGYDSGTDQSFTALNNATAVGAFADVTETNALVLGSILNVNNCTPQNNCASTNVGIGTTSPQYALDVHGTGNFTGLVTFASSQQFPGTGTITAVIPGTDLLGGGTSGNVSLSVDTTKVVTGVTAGTDLTGGGTGGVQTLNLDTTRVPQLNAANTFTGNQTVNGNVSATGG